MATNFYFPTSAWSFMHCGKSREKHQPATRREMGPDTFSCSFTRFVAAKHFLLLHMSPSIHQGHLYLL
jgi:hypothetical protein